MYVWDFFFFNEVLIQKNMNKDSKIIEIYDDDLCDVRIATFNKSWHKIKEKKYKLKWKNEEQ